MPSDEEKLQAPRLFRRRRDRHPPHAHGYVAAGIAGLVCGVVLVALTWLALRATDQGSSVGGRVGLPLLLVIFVVGVVVGGLLLRLLVAADAGTTAFLGTGAVAVIAMFGIGTHLDTTWAAGLVVVISVAAYLVARWFVVRFIEGGLPDVD